MIVTRIYHADELTDGVCLCCGQHSQEILKGDGRCLDCIELDIFYDATMKGL